MIFFSEVLLQVFGEKIEGEHSHSGQNNREETLLKD
jgi:hypothetical protein